MTRELREHIDLGNQDSRVTVGDENRTAMRVSYDSLPLPTAVVNGIACLARRLLAFDYRGPRRPARWWRWSLPLAHPHRFLVAAAHVRRAFPGGRALVAPGLGYPLMIAINAAVKGAGSRSPRIASCWL